MKGRVAARQKRVWTAKKRKENNQKKKKEEEESLERGKGAVAQWKRRMYVSNT